MHLEDLSTRNTYREALCGSLLKLCKIGSKEFHCYNMASTKSQEKNVIQLVLISLNCVFIFGLVWQMREIRHFFYKLTHS
jgi:hypothetical protein